MSSVSQKSVPKLWMIWNLLALCIISVAANAFAAHQHFVRPAPAWMTGARRWYGDVAISIFYAIVSGSCLYYIQYRNRLERHGLPATPRAWHTRHEVRTVLYAFAILNFAAFPAGIYEAFRAMNDASFNQGLLDAIPFEVLIAIPIGIGLVRYDKKRARREFRLSNDLCVCCGYDIRESPGRCPECGKWFYRPKPSQYVDAPTKSATI